MKRQETFTAKEALLIGWFPLLCMAVLIYAFATNPEALVILSFPLWKIIVGAILFVVCSAVFSVIVIAYIAEPEKPSKFFKEFWGR